jgi:ComF family protein
LPSSISRARAIGAYEGALAARLSEMMSQRGGEVLDGAVCVVPVPLHHSRRRARGFNQALDLARGLPLPVCHALRRVRATTTQTSLPAARRHKNVRDAFAATRAVDALSGQIVVLVDDVWTTGATLEACARVLKTWGVAEVRALTAARVVRTRP